MKSVRLLTYAVVCLLIIPGAGASAQNLDGSVVKKAVETYIRQSVPPSVEATIEFQDLKTEYPVASKDNSLSVSLTNSIAMRGLVTFLVKVRGSRRDDVAGQTIAVTVKIRTFQNVLVSTQTVQPHSEIVPEQVTIIRTESTDMQNPVTDLSQLKNKWTSRWLQSGKALTLDMFDDEPIVKRGDDVLIVFKTRNIVVHEQGSALQDGKMNDVIKITNEYKDNLRARVIGKGEVALMN